MIDQPILSNLEKNLKREKSAFVRGHIHILREEISGIETYQEQLDMTILSLEFKISMLKDELDALRKG